MDILSLINEVVDDLSSCESKQQNGDSHKYEFVQNYRVTSFNESDLNKLRKILNEAAILRLHPLSFCDRRRASVKFLRPTPESPLTATEMMERVRIYRNGTGLLAVPSWNWQDEVRALQDWQALDDITRLPLQPLRLEPEPEPYQEMWMHDRPTVVRW